MARVPAKWTEDSALSLAHRSSSARAKRGGYPLTRLGRDLVFTVSANLDAVGEVRTVDAHTILAQSANPTAGVSLPNAAALGRGFGAGTWSTGAWPAWVRSSSAWTSGCLPATA